GARTSAGKRRAIVRLQLERDGKQTNYSSLEDVDEQMVLAHAPDLDIASSRVRLDGLRYRIHLDLPAEEDRRSRVKGEIVLSGVAGRSLPPAVLQGARGWVSGYVVPVLSGPLEGSLDVDGDRIVLDGMAGYHDHNWGFWEGVRWQWGQVAHDDLS